MRTSRVKFGLAFLWLLVVGFPRGARGQGGLRLSLADGTSVMLGAGWAERRNVDIPPPPLLSTSAPRMQFSEFLLADNRQTHSLFELAASDNPFIGSDAYSLDTKLHTGSRLAEHLFYFFFPPPRTCLAQGYAAYQKERSRVDRIPPGQADPPMQVRQFREQSAGLQDLRVAHDCNFAPTLLDLYSRQVASGAVFLRRSGEERVEGTLRNLVLPPMEQVEAGSLTFFVFEAQGQLPIERGELDKYNLPEELRGAKAYFYWAIGAATPFPFVEDPLRKNVPITHVVYATFSSSGAARTEFLELLRQVHLRR